MENKSTTKELLNRRLPQILGSYFVAGTSLVLFIQYLVDKYQFPTHFPTLALFGIIGILPSVIILAYFHGSPGKDNWTKIEKVGVPINILFLGICLLIGNKYGIWGINMEAVNNNPNRHLIVLSSPGTDWQNMFKRDSPDIQTYLLENKHSDIFDIPIDSMKQINMNLESSLLHDFYDEKLILDFKMDEENAKNMTDILKSSDYTNDIAIKLYDLYDNPDQTIFVLIIALENIKDSLSSYVGWTWCYRGNPKNGSVATNSTNILNNISDLQKDLSQIIADNIWDMENDSPKGKVLRVDENIIIFHPGEMKLKKNMTLIGFTEYWLDDKDKDGFTDKDAGLQKRIDDLKGALDYMENNEDEYSLEEINQIRKSYERYSGDSLGEIARGYYTGTFSYKLKVVNVSDTTVVAKLIKRSNPWVKIRPGDKISL